MRLESWGTLVVNRCKVADTLRLSLLERPPCLLQYLEYGEGTVEGVVAAARKRREEEAALAARRAARQAEQAAAQAAAAAAAPHGNAGAPWL